MSDDKDPDIVRLILAACQAEGLSADIAHMIEKSICEQFGGRRVYIPKRSKTVEEKKRKMAFNAGLTEKSTDQIVNECGLSRATLYRLMKRGG